MGVELKLEEGKAYFDIGYNDDNLIVPIIDTYIYVGKNLIEGDKNNYYFQTPSCYFKHGPFYKVDEEPLKSELEIVMMEKDFAEMLHTIDSLCELLKSKKSKHVEMFGEIDEPYHP